MSEYTTLEEIDRAVGCSPQTNFPEAERSNDLGVRVWAGWRI